MTNQPPSPIREYRAVWIATVANIDWPSKPALSTQQQQAELIDILDKAAQLRMNAVILQVRPACSVLYPSRIEPWSEVLSGAMGTPPQPYYDPLAFAVQEAHKRCLEIHAWFNPYRARHPSEKSQIHPQHVSKRRPYLVRTYGRYLWLDPGEPEVIQYSLSVILEVVRQYDIDGVHIDDYFYPYKERDSQGNLIDFPDEPSWQRYRQRGGKLSRDQWRRQNVDRFVQTVYREVKRLKRWVKFGISPFGLWRPGHPPGTRGFDPYAELYADSRKWLQMGWCDYFAPQLYFRIDHPTLSFPLLLRWWSQQNRLRRHLLAGHFASKVADGSNTAWESREIAEQVRLLRQQPGTSGSIHFSARAFMQDRDSICQQIADLYNTPALPPPMPWLSRAKPPAPAVQTSPTGEGVLLQWKRLPNVRVAYWVLAYPQNDEWTTVILPAQADQYLLPPETASAWLCAIDRYGNQGEWSTARQP